MGNQHWPQFQSGIRERSIDCQDSSTTRVRRETSVSHEVQENVISQNKDGSLHNDCLDYIQREYIKARLNKDGRYRTETDSSSDLEFS